MDPRFLGASVNEALHLQWSNFSVVYLADSVSVRIFWH